VDAGVYSGLGATSSHLYWFSSPVRGTAETYDEEEPSPTDLVSFDLEEEEEKVFAKGVTGYDLEAGAEKIAIQKKKGEIYVVETGAEAPDDLEESAVSLDDVVIDLDPREEWKQMYFEGWRNMRDFHWTPDFAGVDWKEVRDRYATLLPRLGIRDDLRDLLGEVIGELSTSHTYIYGGDPGVETKAVPTGLLGARVVRDGAAYRITKIFRGDPADLDRSPLDEPGVNVGVGDYITAVNRRPFPADRPFEAAFANLANRHVVLTVAKDAKGRGARDVVVTPVDNDNRLRYIDWVRSNREAVAAATGGRVGYIHLPDMGSNGLIEFNRWFYPQLDKEGMVVDCRWNGGGNVSQMIVERLSRKIVSWDRARGGGIYSYPYRALRGPFVVLLNEQAGSDGDIFPYVCQYEGLAKIIGERSWGGVVGIRGDKALVDGGSLTQPEFAWWDERRGWAIENHGVDPDIVVVDTPHDAAAGRDRQLERGIEEVLGEMSANPPKRPTFEGEIPNKSRAGFLEREGKIR
jgi:tricorn protease